MAIIYYTVHKNITLQSMDGSVSLTKYARTSHFPNHSLYFLLLLLVNEEVEEELFYFLSKYLSRSMFVFNKLFFLSLLLVLSSKDRFTWVF